MKLLVTGGLGLIGRGVLRKAKETGLSLRVVDIRKESLPGVECIQGDVADASVANDVVRGCDVVLHLAGYLGVRETEADPLGTLDANIRPARMILDACVRHDVQRMVFSSSSEIYGCAQGGLTESEEPRPRSTYAVAKLAVEKYALAYQHRYGLDVRIIRYFNVYGPGQRNAFVVPKFIEAVNRKARPVLYGGGHQIRSFCYIDDAAVATLALAFADALPERVFNIGNDQEPVRMRDLANRIVRLSGADVEPMSVSFDRSDRTEVREIHTRIPNIDRARRLLGYEPRVSLDEGLRQLLAISREESLGDACA